MDIHQTRQTLLIRVTSGDDETAWDEFTQSYERFIFHVLHRMGVSSADIDDLAQDVLIRLWEKLKSYDPSKAKFRTWLGVVIRNLVLNHLKTKKIRASKVQHLEDLEHLALESAKHSEVDAMIEKEWKLHISNMALETIKNKFSDTAFGVFMLSMEGHDVEDVAKRFTIKQASVKVLKSRVKKLYLKEVQRLIKELETL